ncbi:uncharacterized protein [Garra rufa]|uniref:uncharacterized protein n=1 Tax=Garra rufa TaxID=137080 RepID=UPI003CCEF070
MADKCHLCLLGLTFLSSLLTGTSGVDDTHVFISSGENVRLPCNNALPDCKSTTWNYNDRHSATIELIRLGIKKKNSKIHERLSLGSDCSLNIKNIIKEDYGSYICQQWTGVKKNQKQGDDLHVFLHVLRVSSSSSQTEISPGSSVTLSCQLDSSYAGVSCDDWIRSEGIELFWVNQAGDKLMISDSGYQIIFSSGHCIITLTTKLLNEDDNREWRCAVTHRNQVKTSATHTVKSSAPPPASYSSLLQPQYSLFTATPMPMPSNATASEPPQVAHSIRAQILAEIQDSGSRGGTIPNSSSSLFRIKIPLNHPLKPLLDASLNTILQAFSP